MTDPAVNFGYGTDTTERFSTISEARRTADGSIEFNAVLIDWEADSEREAQA